MRQKTIIYYSKLTSHIIPMLLCLAAPVLLSGCAAEVTAILERPVSSENINLNKLVVMTGERRLAIVAPFDKNNPEDRQKIICAESLPDAARFVKATSEGEAKTSGSGGVSQSLSMKELFETALTKTYDRTETSDVVRQLGWQVCQAYVNRAIDTDQYYQLLNKLVDGSFQTMKATKAMKATSAGGK